MTLCYSLLPRVPLCYPVFPSVTLCYVVFPCVTLCFPVLFCVPLGYPVLPCVNLIVYDRQLKYYSQTMVSGHREYFLKDDCLQRFGFKYYCKSLS